MDSIMKAERRHELRENDLAHFLAVARQYLEDNGGRIGLIIFAVIAVVAVATFTMRSRAAELEDVWRRKNQLTFEDVETGRESLRALQSLAGETHDRHLAMSCLVEMGQQSLRLARQVPWPPDRELNAQAETAFKQLLDRFADNPIAVGVALSGLATVEENWFLLDRDLAHKDKTRHYLSRIIEEPLLNGMPFQKLAIERRNKLDETFVLIRFDNPEPELPPDDGAVDEADLVDELDESDGAGAELVDDLGEG